MDNNNDNNINIMYLNMIGFKLRACRVVYKSNLIKCRFFRSAEKWSTWGKISQSRELREPTNSNQMMLCLEIEPGPHWWQASAVTTRPLLL